MYILLCGNYDVELSSSSGDWRKQMRIYIEFGITHAASCEEPTVCCKTLVAVAVVGCSREESPKISMSVQICVVDGILYIKNHVILLHVQHTAVRKVCIH